MSVFEVHDTHKPQGETFVERISTMDSMAEYALQAWWLRTKRNDGGPVDTDRYEAREARR